MLMTSGQMVQDVEELQPITCFCIFDQRGSTAPQLWRSSERRSSPITWLPFFSIPARHRCLPEAMHHSTLTSLASFASQNQKEASWTRLILNMQDIFSFIKKDLKIVTQQDTFTRDRHNSFIIFCNEDLPLQLFGNTYTCRTSIEDTGWHISDNGVLSDLKNSTAHWSHGPNTNSSEGIQHELVRSDNFNTHNPKSLLKSSQIYNTPGLLSRCGKTVKKRKSVSFNNDVIVYLFNQVLFSCCLFNCSLVSFI